MATCYSFHGSEGKMKSEVVDSEKNVYKFGKNDKKPVDADAPKRPLSAYMRFVADKREGIKKKNPDAAMIEVTKEIGQLWKKASDSEKKPYIDKVEKEKATYTKLMNAYKMSKSYKDHLEKMHQWRVHCTKKAFKKDENAPKKPMSAWFLYAQDERPKVLEENPEFKVTEVMKEVSNRWKQLSTEQQKPWVDQAAKAKTDFAKAVEEYHKTEEYKAYDKEKTEYQAKMKKERQRLIKEWKQKNKSESSAAAAAAAASTTRKVVDEDMASDDEMEVDSPKKSKKGKKFSRKRVSPARKKSQPRRKAVKRTKVSRNKSKKQSSRSRSSSRRRGKVVRKKKSKNDKGKKKK